MAQSLTLTRKEVAGWVRWLHIYLSMFSFATLLFFAATGVTLNHPEWIEGRQTVQQFDGRIEPAWIATTTPVKELDVVEFFRNNYGVRARMSDFITDDTECSVSFKGPGYSADAFVDRETGAFEMTITQYGVVAIMNDLHKGRDTGGVWAWLIDVSAVLMILVSLTGFIMIFFLRKWRLNGGLLAGAGAIAMIIIYLVFGR
jgi:uncharacterized protein